jgi:hypothetical protein
VSAEPEEAFTNFFLTGTQFTNLKLLCNNLVGWKGDHQTTETKESSSTEECILGIVKEIQHLILTHLQGALSP